MTTANDRYSELMSILGSALADDAVMLGVLKDLDTTVGARLVEAEDNIAADAVEAAEYVAHTDDPPDIALAIVRDILAVVTG
jgi:CHASE3 domain sensor protein